MKLLETFTAEVVNVRIICSAVEDKLKEWSLPENDCYDIILSIDEAITNIILHGYKKVESANNVIEIDLKKELGIIKVKLVDFGKSFDLNSIQRPNIVDNLKQGKYGGYGVFLMKSLMDSVKYTRKDGRNVTEMEKTVEYQ